MIKPEIGIELQPSERADFEELVIIRVSATKESLEGVGRFYPARAGKKPAKDFVIEQGIKEQRNIRLIALKKSRATDFFQKNGFSFDGSMEFDNVYVRNFSASFSAVTHV